MKRASGLPVFLNDVTVTVAVSEGATVTCHYSANLCGTYLNESNEVSFQDQTFALE